MSGTVEEILVGEGDSVEKGQLLAKLDTSEWERELLGLKRNLRDAERALERAENPGEGEAPDPLDVEIAELDVENAKLSLEEAENASPIITAPFDGFITSAPSQN
jgi:multidrug resistance efflux pump